jgi:hypothetical protein
VAGLVGLVGLAWQQGVFKKKRDDKSFDWNNWSNTPGENVDLGLCLNYCAEAKSPVASRADLRKPSLRLQLFLDHQPSLSLLASLVSL